MEHGKRLEVSEPKGEEKHGKQIEPRWRDIKGFGETRNTI